MNENLPMKIEKGIFGKIKNFFRRLFYKSSQIVEQNNIEEYKTDEIKEKKAESFVNNIKVEVDDSIQKELKRNELFQKIRKNPEMLDTLSSKQLKNLSKYYDKVIEKNNEIIENKKAKLNKVS